MRFFIIIGATCANAFPFVLQNLASSSRPLSNRDSPTVGETNCGPLPCLIFDAEEQFVDVSAASGHQYIAPTSSDQRGPCPGLNAAANHGYIPRSGILNTLDAVTGLGAAFGMGADIAAALAVLAIVLNGDPLQLTWSIGGAYNDPIMAAIGEEPQGLSYSHNNYEGDSSVTRQDAYLNNGDDSSLIISRFEALYNSAESYTLENIRSQLAQNQQYSVENNPYYFSAQFSGLLVVPAAHNFIINFFSNHSAEQPSGYLDRETLKSFFGVTGEPGSFVAHQGAERIPENWYRRPTSNQYDLTRAISDVVAGYAADPSTFKLGGNANGVNTFTGVDVGDLTGGVFNAETLLEGNNFGCFVLLAQQEDFPDILKGFEGDLSPLTDLLAQYFSPLLTKLECPQLETYNQGLFNDFPGYKYHPSSTDPSGIGQQQPGR